MDERKPFNLARYLEGIGTRPCFICQMLRGVPGYEHHVIDEDADTIIFLSRYPTLRGYALVCPKRHVDDLAEGLSETEYLVLQAKIHRLARALKRSFAAERIYVLSLGSQLANSHLHFHVVPLPPGVPLEQQQYHALMVEHGVLELPDAELRAMAQAVGDSYRALS